jgi:Flp pilus assembly protein TadD
VLALDKIGDLAEMTQRSQRYFAAGGRDPQILERLAGQLEGSAALAVQRSLALIVPLQITARAALADGLMAAQRSAEAVSEYQVVLALEPHDRATAHYQLAAALAASGEVAQAQQQVLLALEIAPRYSEALSLLVKLQE